MAEGESPAQAAEAAAIRRRWITLGEILAVIAVLISGLTLWNSYSERSATELERAAEKKQEEERARNLVLAFEKSRKMLALFPLDQGQAIQSQTISFPTLLGISPIRTVGNPRIETGWIKTATKKARGSNGDAAAVDDRRMPVAITTQFVAGGHTYTDVAIYEISYRREGSLLGGSEITLLGLALVEHSSTRSVQARLDKAWKELER